MQTLLQFKILNVPLSVYMSFLLVSVLFIVFPSIDIFVTSLFYDGSFYLKGTLFEKLLYQSVPLVIILLSVGTITLYLYNFFTKKRVLGLSGRVFIYAILVLALAPGLIVNTTLKEHWGRARPNQITQFGGHKKFTPAFVISNQGGNSFSSGHGAAAFSLLGFALLAKRARKFYITLALLYGLLVSFARIIGGGHFLSDSLTSFFIVYIVTYSLYHIIIKRRI